MIDLLVAAALGAVVSTAPLLRVEAESGDVFGGTRKPTCADCSGGLKVGYIGNGAANYLLLSVDVRGRGRYRMTLHFLVDGRRDLYYRINGGPAASVTLAGHSFSRVAAPRSVVVTLAAGRNTIRFYNDGGYAPDLDRVVLRPD